MIDSTQWLPLWLLPGLIGALVGLGWFYWRGVRRGRLVWGLAGLSAAWTFGITLVAQGWWTLGLLTLGLAFGGLVALVAWHEKSQQAEIARLRRLAEAPSERIAALGHDIRTPLTIIGGKVEQLLDGHPGPLTPLQIEFLQAANRECERAIALAKDLLIQARIEAGIFKLRPEPVDIRALARQVVSAIRLLTADRQQVISLDYPKIMGPIQADPGLLTRALTNLLNNACRYTSDGGHIYVTVADNDGNVVISVMDDGAGMSAEERRSLFQKFASSRQFGDGTGLGLVITRQIIELHGGKILVDTSLGRGTTVLFTLPRQ